MFFDTIEILFYVLLAIGLICAASIAAQYIVGRINAEKCRLAEEAEEARQKQEEYLRERERRIQQQTSLALADTVKQARDAADRHYKSSIPAGTLEQLQEHLKANMLMFQRQSRLITARVAGTPTGWVGIEWTVDPCLPSPFRIVISCNGKSYFSGQMYLGFLTDLLKRGEHHQFAIRIYGSDRYKVEDELNFTVMIPTPSGWNRPENPPPKPPPSPPPPPPPPPPKVDPILEMQKRIQEKAQYLLSVDEAWLQARREGEKQIDALDLPEPEKKRLKARRQSQLQTEQDND